MYLDLKTPYCIMQLFEWRNIETFPLTNYCTLPEQELGLGAVKIVYEYDS